MNAADVVDVAAEQPKSRGGGQDVAKWAIKFTARVDIQWKLSNKMPPPPGGGGSRYSGN